MCFTVVDGLPQEAVWRAWAAACGAGGAGGGVDVSFFVHAHRPERVRSPWVRERLIGPHYETKWGSVELVRATLALLDDALKGDPALVAFASETCVPVADPRAVAALLDGGDDDKDDTNDTNDTNDAGGRRRHPRSRLLATGRPNNGYSLQVQFAKVDRAVDAAHVWKADQWVLLSRLHAEAAARLDSAVRFESRRPDDAAPLWRLLRKCTAPDELLFPVSLSLCGELRRPDAEEEAAAKQEEAPDQQDGPATAPLRPLPNDALAPSRLTHCDWSQNGKSPKTFPALDAAIVDQARADGCLFARKFKDPVDVDAWRALVLPAAAAPPPAEGAASPPRDADDASPPRKRLKPAEDQAT